MSKYLDFLKNWNFDKYIEDIQRIGLDKKLRQRIDYLQEMRETGYDLIYLKSISTENSGVHFHVPVEKFYETKRFAYHMSRYGDAYANIILVIAKSTDVEDSNGDIIYQTPDGISFVIKEDKDDDFPSVNIEFPSI